MDNTILGEFDVLTKFLGLTSPCVQKLRWANFLLGTAFMQVICGPTEFIFGNGKDIFTVRDILMEPHFGGACFSRQKNIEWRWDFGWVGGIHPVLHY